MKPIPKIILSVFALSMLTSCASWRRDKSPEYTEKINEEVTEQEIQNPMKEIQQDYGAVELVVNQQVLKWMNYYKGRGRKHMHRYLERSTRYLKVMREVLREEGLPEDLVYLPIIESGFSSSAHSHASAVGYWQFIRGTGLRYGLQIDSYIDQRRDPIESTRAAARFLKALYNLFGDWYLALAAYNTGENRVKRAVMKYGTRDFWKLAKKRRLYRETRDYVPKYLAALIIAKNPEQYGFSDLDYKDGFAYDSIPVFRSISLEKLGNNIGTSFQDMRALNPMYRSDYVPVESGKTVYIRVPKGMAQKSVAALEASYSEAPSFIPKDYFYYRVRGGDTLSGIAYRNRTTVATIRRLNELGRRSFIRVGQKLKLPDRGMRTLREHKASVAAKTIERDGLTYHTVRRGENLSYIAKLYGTTVSQLKRLNSMGRRSMIRAGQKLIVKEEPQKESRSPSSREQRSLAKVHVVKSGENLTLIGRKYGIATGDLIKWNDLSRRGKIFKGQKLNLVDNGKSIVHVVRSGENLSVIAQRYKVSVADIARENELKSRSKIYVGRRLVIPE